MSPEKPTPAYRVSESEWLLAIEIRLQHYYKVMMDANLQLASLQQMRDRTLESEARGMRVILEIDETGTPGSMIGVKDKLGFTLPDERETD